jgi:hypothetical protein
MLDVVTPVTIDGYTFAPKAFVSVIIGGTRSIDRKTGGTVADATLISSWSSSASEIAS